MGMLLLDWRRITDDPREEMQALLEFPRNLARLSITVF